MNDPSIPTFGIQPTFDPLTSDETYGQAIADEINYVNGLGILKSRLECGDNSLLLQGETIAVQGLSGQQKCIAGRLEIDPGAVVKLAGTAIEAGLGAQFIAEGTAANPITFTSISDDTCAVRAARLTRPTTAVRWAKSGGRGGFYFSPTSQGSLDYAQVFYAGGSVATEGTFAVFAPV